MNDRFKDEYEKLNPSQREAVEALDGPVMVVAGPGTGKTQVLALRIANILTKTDTPASGILSLTFTNAGVRAMRERLLRLIGSRASEVYVSTFHRFAIGLIEKHFALLDLDAPPELLSDTEAVALSDDILESGEWRHIRPRGDSAKYFSDLKSLISLLKRENIAPEAFLAEVEADIEATRTDPENLSSRGARKGELKREAESKISSLERTREVVRFYEAYEKEKHARGMMDYDDVLSFAVRLAQTSEDVRAELRENYLYVLVDEHQDSSGVQNAFLEAVWGSTERPNIFVVGDDRQLIYGFGGASIEHFTHFRTMFGKAAEITLVENYRSTQTILDAADALLESSVAAGKLVSTTKADEHKIRILECDYPRDEIIYIARDIKEKISQGIPPEEIAVLVPKNYQARVAAAVLRDQGVPVAAGGSASFFSLPETHTVRRVLSVLADPYDTVALGALLLDPIIGIPPLEAHAFLRETNTRKLSLETLVLRGTNVLGVDPIARFGASLKEWLDCSRSLGLYGLIQKIGEDLFFKQPADHDALIREVEIVRTFIHLLTAENEKNPHSTLSDFVRYLDRLEHYGHELALAVFAGGSGVRVFTLHGSKGLEFAAVYVAHLDENSLMKGRRQGFVLPDRMSALVESKNELVARRELYVAITRAKEFCTLSYSRHAYAGGELLPARILADLPDKLTERKTITETEGELLAEDPKLFVRAAAPAGTATKDDLAKVVAEEYTSVNVSVTLLNNFFECPWKWYFRNLLKLPESKTESLLLGSVVHTGIEYLLKHRNAATPEGLERALSDCLENEYVCDTALIVRTTREAKKIIAAFQKDHLPLISPDAVSERSITYRDPKLPHLSCYGKIDMTERMGEGSVRVTDFKTGTSKPKTKIEKRTDEGRMSDYMRQLAMYSYLIENAEKGTSVSESRLLFLEEDPKEKDTIYSAKIGLEEIALLKKDIADYDELVQSGAWVRRPCEAELYGKNEKCEYCQKAELLYR